MLHPIVLPEGEERIRAREMANEIVVNGLPSDTQIIAGGALRAIRNGAQSLYQRAKSWGTAQFKDNFHEPSVPLSEFMEIMDARSWDYPSGYNSNNWQDVGRSNVTIAHLRNFSENCEPLRLIIENVKKKLRAIRIDVQLRDVSGKTPTEVRDETENNAQVKRGREILKKPDGKSLFINWISEMIEELLVIDYVCVYKQLNMLDESMGMRLIDGDTIVKKINRMGETPDFPGVAYQQKIKGVVVKEFNEREMLVYHYNTRVNKVYGYGPCEQIIDMVRTSMNRSKFQSSYYTEGNIPDMLVRVAPEWTDKQIGAFQKYFDALLSGNAAKRRKIRFIPNGLDPIIPQKDTLTDEFDEWIMRFISHAFSVSANPWIKNLNRATSEQSREQSDEEGLFFWMAILKNVLDTLLDEWYGLDEIEVVWIPNQTQDSQKQAEIDASDVKHGIRSIDEVRDARGLAPLGIPNMVITGQGYVIIDTKMIANSVVKQLDAMDQSMQPPKPEPSPSTDKDTDKANT